MRQLAVLLLTLLTAAPGCADLDDCSLAGVAAGVAGIGAQDCGSVRESFDENGEVVVDAAAARALDDCMVAAFEAGRPFVAIFWYQGVDSEVGDALAGTRHGRITLIAWDSDPCGGGGCGPDIQAIDCLSPSVVEVEGRRALTCAGEGATRALSCGDEASGYGTAQGGE